MSKSNCNLNVITRRSFLDRSFKTTAAVALGTLMDIPLVMKRALAEGNIGLNGKKVLFIWLRGANDGLNSVIPILDPAYATARPDLAIPRDLGTNYAQLGSADFPVSGSAGSVYGAYPYAIRLGNGFAALHPSLKFLAPVYNSSLVPNKSTGDLALIHRVAYPRQSRSHFDSQRYWENGSPGQNLVNDGIFYRTMLESGLAHTAPLTGVSVQSSLPLLLRGSDAAMTNLSDPLRFDLLGIPNTTPGNAKASAYLNNANAYAFPFKASRDLLQLQYQNMTGTLGIFSDLRPMFEESGNTFRDNEITDGDTAWANANGGEGYYLFPTESLKNGGWRRPDGTNEPDKYVVPTNLHTLFQRLKAAAIILNKTDAIIAGTEYGGFDTHSAQGQLTGAHPGLNQGFGWAMYALRKYFTRYADRAPWKDVVIVTLSEFGRTTIENADNGTDHAEAGVMFVAGGAVKGYDPTALPNPRSGVFNCNPNEPTPTDVRRWIEGPANQPGIGDGSMFGVNDRYLRRANDYRQVLGEIIRNHLGATQNQLNRIIPGYANPAENLLGGGASIDGTEIRGELGII